MYIHKAKRNGPRL
uniref:Uncharacterized protein n=1 Tax=Rhizophora mucronata TaxID=61149 RepID=A0A2P2QTC2_RHIMU